MCLSIVTGVLIARSALTQEGGNRDGEVRQSSEALQAWDSESGHWVSLESFWESFAGRGPGKRWPDGAVYPPYQQVSEHDTFLVRSEKGVCLMYFFHTRWRRANDVWRWSDEFNNYGGCPYVFD